VCIPATGREQEYDHYATSLLAWEDTGVRSEEKRIDE
jgi:hypothetical protein